MRDNPEVQVNGQFPKQTEITSVAPERKRPYPAHLNVLQAEADSRSGPAAPRPPWLKATLPGGPNYLRLKALVKEHSLHLRRGSLPQHRGVLGSGDAHFHDSRASVHPQLRSLRRHLWQAAGI